MATDSSVPIEMSLIHSIGLGNADRRASQRWSAGCTSIETRPEIEECRIEECAQVSR